MAHAGFLQVWEETKKEEEGEKKGKGWGPGRIQQENRATALGHKMTDDVMQLDRVNKQGERQEGEQRETSKYQHRAVAEGTQSLQSVKQGLPLFRA